ncbi:hypothetical protein SAMN04487831_106123 [Pseudobutyrivibrio sp. UC1225]|nr:hypothetical protein SAMN04487831_106123 [Pseudobutyrivibrio sp. UC1225]
MCVTRNSIYTGYQEGISESVFSFYSSLMTEEDAVYSEEIGRLKEAIDSLTAVQQRRIRLYFLRVLHCEK